MPDTVLKLKEPYWFKIESVTQRPDTRSKPCLTSVERRRKIDVSATRAHTHTRTHPYTFIGHLDRDTLDRQVVVEENTVSR